jgi:hypothetical protein
MNYYDYDEPKIKKSTLRKELRLEFVYETKLSRIVRRRVRAHYSVLRAISVFQYKRLETKNIN